MIMVDTKIVYVTGCAGFIGCTVAELCLNMGWYVIGVDKMTYASSNDAVKYLQQLGEDRFKMLTCDINDLTFLYDCDYIINCAAETHVGNSIVNSDEFIHSNVRGVHHLLKLLREYRQENGKTPTLLHFSTDEVYGDIQSGFHTESDMLRPSNPYSATKAAADMLILAWSRTYGIPYVIVRPTNNYGIGQYAEKLIPKAVKYLGLGRKIPLHNGGSPVRSWLHVYDTGAAIIEIILNGVVNEIFNISGGFEQTNEETVRKIISCWNDIHRDNPDMIVEYESVVDLGIHREGQDVRYALDDSKLRSLGWTPVVNFDDTIGSIVEYYSNKFLW